MLLAVLATFLSTLICIAHCHTTLQIRQATTSTSTAIVSPGHDGLFICHSPGGETPAAPVSINIDALRALYEPAPADGLLFLTSTTVMLLPLATLPPVAPQTSPAPDTPPPRIFPA
jgi:hypothetical protein